MTIRIQHAIVTRVPPLGAIDRRFLCALLDVHGTGTAAELDTLAARVSWPAVLGAARAANLLPLLATQVLAHAAWPVDPDTRQRLASALEDTAVYNTRLLAELARTVSILRAAQVEHVVLKGAVLLAQYYPRITLRHTVDLDLLIDPERFEAGVSALRAAGYVDDPHYTGTLVGDGTSMADAWPARAHATPPLKTPSGVTIDLHHRVPLSGFVEGGGFRGWLARSRPFTLHGVSVQLCERMDLAVHLCEHFALQHHADPHDAPKLLCDLRALYPEHPPWAQLARGETERRLSVAIAKALYTAAFTTPEARDPFSRLLRRVAIADPSVSAPLVQLSHLRGHASRFSFNVRTRPRYALRTLFPTRAYMAQHHHVAPSSARIYPLYAKRLLTTLWRTR